MMSRVKERLERLGFSLPALPPPVAAYVPGVKVDKLVFTSGQLPLEKGEVKYKGQLGRDLTLEEGYAAARLCALNCLAVIQSLAGDLDAIAQVVKVTGYVNSTPEFWQQPQVVNGASELLVEVLGEAGRHARAAVGVSSLPLGAAVELEMVVKLK